MKMNQPTTDPCICPLCGDDNNCQLCTPATYKGQCWCAAVKFPDGLLERVPPELRNKACLCHKCVTQFRE